MTRNYAGKRGSVRGPSANQLAGVFPQKTKNTLAMRDSACVW